MKNMLKKATLVAVGTLVVGSAMASQPSVAQPAKTDLYAGAVVGYAKLDEKAAGASADRTKDLAYGINAGAMVNEKLGVEAGYTKYPNQHFASVKGKRNYGVNVAAKGVMSLGDSYSAFAKAGVVRMHHTVDGATSVADASGNHHAYTAMGALGVSDKMNDTTSVSAELSGSLKHNNVPAVVMASLGVGFAF